MSLVEFDDQIPITRDDHKKLTRIVHNMINNDHSVEFRKPVYLQSLGLDNYKKIVKKPMDLNTIRRNLNKNTYLYINDFIAEVLLIWNNCKLYNEQGSWIYNEAIEMQKYFKEQFEEAFPHIPFINPDEMLEQMQQQLIEEREKEEEKQKKGISKQEIDKKQHSKIGSNNHQNSEHKFETKDPTTLQQELLKASSNKNKNNKKSTQNIKSASSKNAKKLKQANKNSNGNGKQKNNKQQKKKPTNENQKSKDAKSAIGVQQINGIATNEEEKEEIFQDEQSSDSQQEGENDSGMEQENSNESEEEEEEEEEGDEEEEEEDDEEEEEQQQEEEQSQYKTYVPNQSNSNSYNYVKSKNNGNKKIKTNEKLHHFSNGDISSQSSNIYSYSKQEHNNIAIFDKKQRLYNNDNQIIKQQSIISQIDQLIPQTKNSHAPASTSSQSDIKNKNKKQAIKVNQKEVEKHQQQLNFLNNANIQTNDLIMTQQEPVHLGPLNLLPIPHSSLIELSKQVAQQDKETIEKIFYIIHFHNPEIVREISSNNYTIQFNQINRTTFDIIKDFLSNKEQYNSIYTRKLQNVFKNGNIMNCNGKITTILDEQGNPTSLMSYASFQAEATKIQQGYYRIQRSINSNNQIYQNLLKMTLGKDNDQEELIDSSESESFNEFDDSNLNLNIKQNKDALENVSANNNINNN